LRQSRFYFCFCCFSFWDAPRVEGALTDIRHAGNDLFYGCAKSKAHSIACKKQCALACRPRGTVRDTTQRTAQGRTHYMSGLMDWIDSGISTIDPASVLEIEEIQLSLQGRHPWGSAMEPSL
jgi:hypothetical protein